MAHKSLNARTGKRLACENLEPRMMLTATPVAPDWHVEFQYGTDDDPPGVERLDAAVDASGNLTLIGWFTGTVDFDPGSGTHELTSTFSRELFVAKYDTAGALINAVDVGDFYVYSDPQIAVDESGSAYILSGYTGSGTLLNGQTLPPQGNSGMSAFVSKLDSALQTMEWASFIHLGKNKGFSGNFFPRHIAVDAVGTSVYVTAGTSGAGTFAGSLVSYDGVSESISRFDADDGGFQWTAPLPFYGSFGLEVDPTDSNSIFVGGDRSVSQGQQDYDEGILQQVNLAGEIVAETVFSTGSNTWWQDLDVHAGQVFVAGQFSGDLTLGQESLTSYGGVDAITARYDAATDDIVWASQAGGADDDTAQQISVDSLGNVFLGGDYQGIATFGSDTLAESTTADVFFSQLEAADGSFLQTWRYGRADIADLVTANGATYIAGRFRASSVDFPTGELPLATTDVHNYIMRFEPAVDATIPRITGFVASPRPAETDSPVSLDAVGVFDPAARVDSISFYHDVDGNRRLDPAVDALLGTDFNGADGWSFDASTTSLPIGDITFLAQATYDGGLPSLAVSAGTFLRLPSTDYVSTDVEKAISDLTTITSSLNVPHSFAIGDVDVTLSISHTGDTDLDVFLLHPDGTRIELFTDLGGFGDNFTNTVLDDQTTKSITSGQAPFTGRFQPEGSLVDLNGKDSAGTWILEVTDDERKDTGTLDAWSLTLAPQTLLPPTLRVDDVTVTEGDGGTTTATFLVTRSGDTSPAVSVDFTTTDGTATAGSDYTTAAGTINFASGEVSKTINVAVLGDVVEELDETFFVDLSNATGATITDPQAVATILDDDAVSELIDVYIADIRFDSKRGGKDWRAVVEIRDEEGNAVEGVSVKVDFNGATYTLETDSSGIARTSWVRNLADGTYVTDAYDLALTGYFWDPFSLLNEEADSDGDGYPDDVLVV